ncbi:MAG: pyruvate formate lyase family protein, partial [Clostridium sp.]
MSNYSIPKSTRINKLIDALFEKIPEIEADRGILITESYMKTEDKPIITRRAEAFAHILENIPIVIRDNELIVGSTTKSPRGCQVFPEFSFSWLESEFDTIEKRSADPFYISEETKVALKNAYKYWHGKTTSELATSYMNPDTIKAIEHNIFTPGNYYYNGVGHVTVCYDKILEIGYEGIIKEAQDELKLCRVSDMDYVSKSQFLNSVILSCKAVINYAKRYSVLAKKLAEKCIDKKRKKELEVISKNCD